MINDRQIKTRLGKKTDGSVVYSSLDKVIASNIPVLDVSARVNFSLSADSDVHILTTGEIPSGNVYIDGSTYESINGGVACATIKGSLGANETTTNIIGGRIVNIVKILDSGNDDQLKIEYTSGNLTTAKYVFGLIQTDLNDGSSVEKDRLQLSFVVWDDSTNAFIAVTLPASNYKFEVVRMYNVGTASEANKLGSILSGGGGLGGVSLEELSDLLKGINGYTSLVLTSEAFLPSKIITCNITGDTTTEWKDSDGNDISGNTVQSGSKKYDVNSIDSLAYTTEGVEVFYNGIKLPISRVIIKSVTSVEIDLSDTAVTNILYEGDIIELKF